MFGIKSKIKGCISAMRDKRILSGLSAAERNLINSIRQNKLTYLSNKKLASLARTINAVEQNSVQGIFVEAGCALGGSGILISALKQKERKFFIHDVFGLIPAPSQNDTADVFARYETIVQGKSAGLGGDIYYGYQENLYEKVLDNFKKMGIDTKEKSVEFVKGLVQDTMPSAWGGGV